MGESARAWDGGVVGIHVKRIYEDPVPEDGYRVLVDRIWPRGVSKERAQLDEWLKDVAPTTELRKWFNHEEPKWHEFQKRYAAELDKNDAVSALRKIIAGHPVVTLVYPDVSTMGDTLLGVTLSGGRSGSCSWLIFELRKTGEYLEAVAG